MVHAHCENQRLGIGLTHAPIFKRCDVPLEIHNRLILLNNVVLFFLENRYDAVPLVPVKVTASPPRTTSIMRFNIRTQRSSQLPVGSWHFVFDTVKQCSSPCTIPLHHPYRDRVVVVHGSPIPVGFYLADNVHCVIANGSGTWHRSLLTKCCNQSLPESR